MNPPKRNFKQIPDNFKNGEVPCKCAVAKQNSASLCAVNKFVPLEVITLLLTFSEFTK